MVSRSGRRRSVLCVGGLDPAGRAGLLVDAQAVRAQGLHPICVAAALTFQSSKRMLGFYPVPAEVLARQLSVVLDDEAPAAVKLGQLASPENVEIMARFLRERGLGGRTVVDTPVRSSLGAELFSGASLRNSYASLMSVVALVTPNAPEALLLAGTSGKDMDMENSESLGFSANSDCERQSDPELEPDKSEKLSLVELTDLERSIQACVALGAEAVLLTGGHVEEDGETVVDRLIVGGKMVEMWSSPRLSGNFRGTGCRLASAVASHLALGKGLSEAIFEGRNWLSQQLKSELVSSQ